MSLTRPRAILFDWDNTLVDTWPVIHESLNVCMREMGKEAWSFAQVKGKVKHSMRESFPVLFGDRWEDAAQIYQETYRSIHLQRLTALDGAEETLQYIAKHADVFCGIVSNKRGPTLRMELEHIGWSPLVHVAIGAGDAEKDKPSMVPMVHALKDSGVMPGKDVWFIGDTTVDLQCANEGGAVAILYGDVSHNDISYEGVPMHAHVKDQGALLKLLEQHLG